MTNDPIPRISIYTRTQIAADHRQLHCFVNNDIVSTFFVVLLWNMDNATESFVDLPLSLTLSKKSIRRTVRRVYNELQLHPALVFSICIIHYHNTQRVQSLQLFDKVAKSIQYTSTLSAKPDLKTNNEKCLPLRASHPGRQYTQMPLVLRGNVKSHPGSTRNPLVRVALGVQNHLPRSTTSLLVRAARCAQTTNLMGIAVL